MSNKILLVGVISLFLLTSCEYSNQTYSEKYDISEPTQEAPIVVESYKITGMVQMVLSDSTEFGCEYGEKDSEVKCNSGTGVFYLSNIAETVFLEDYSCPITQYYIHNSSGIKSIEYRPDAECNEWLTIGKVYTATGELTVKKDVRKTVYTNGDQVEEQWLKVDSITTTEKHE
jgi:hypothetical protein